MSFPENGWKNKKGTADRVCSSCGTWKKHWMKLSKKLWPTFCCNYSCSNPAELGAHVFHPNVTGEQIVALCTSCNGLDEPFSLVPDTIYISAQKCL